MRDLKEGETYTGNELYTLCNVAEEDRHRFIQGIIGQKASVIIEGTGNDNWKVLKVIEE